jgi:rare lipoprotein A
MTAIATLKASIFRASTWAGIAVVLTVGINSTNVTESAAPSNPLAAKPSASAPENSAPRKVTHHWYQLGRASWYGQDFQGRPTASGESFNMYDLNCAHRSLPLGSLIRVTNLHNRKTVVVRVNDRGPVPEDRIVDLSFAAANFLGMNGLAKVRVELLSGKAPSE